MTASEVASTRRPQTVSSPTRQPKDVGPISSEACCALNQDVAERVLVHMPWRSVQQVLGPDQGPYALAPSILRREEVYDLAW